MMFQLHASALGIALQLVLPDFQWSQMSYTTIQGPIMSESHKKEGPLELIPQWQHRWPP